MKFRTTSLSTGSDNIGDTDIGRRSEGIETRFVLGTGVTAAIFQADGTLPIEREQLISFVITCDRPPAQSRETQYGIPSLPGDVLRTFANNTAMASLQ